MCVCMYLLTLMYFGHTASCSAPIKVHRVFLLPVRVGNPDMESVTVSVIWIEYNLTAGRRVSGLHYALASLIKLSIELG